MSLGYNLFFGILIILFFVGCNNKADIIIIPSNILSQEQMAAILTDVHLAEAKIKLLKKVQGSHITEADNLAMKNKVFEEHKIEKKQFDESLSYYSSHPKLFETIYDKILVTLEEGKIKADTIKGNKN